MVIPCLMPSLNNQLTMTTSVAGMVLNTLRRSLTRVDRPFNITLLSLVSLRNFSKSSILPTANSDLISESILTCVKPRNKTNDNFIRNIFDKNSQPIYR